MATVKQPLGRRRIPRRAEVTCKLITTLVMEYLIGEMDPDGTRRFEEHLHECPDCVAFLNTYKKASQAPRLLRDQEMPAQMQRRLRQFLRERMSKSPRGH